MRFSDRATPELQKFLRAQRAQAHLEVRAGRAEELEALDERAVVQHSAGRRFERGVDALSRRKSETGAKNVLLTERDPRVAEAQSREAAAKREADAAASRGAWSKTNAAAASAGSTPGYNVSAFSLPS